MAGRQRSSGDVSLLWFDEDDPLARSRGVPPQRAFRYKPQKQRNCNLEKLRKFMWPLSRAQRLKIEKWLRAFVQEKKKSVLTQMSLTHKAVPPPRRAKGSNSKNGESDNPIAPSSAFPSSTGARFTLSGKSVKGCKSNDFIFEGRTAKRRPRRRRLCYISTAVAKSTNLV